MFHLGFKKISSDHNNQGLEFNKADTNNSTANVGPGGMSPQGIESYQPTPENKNIFVNGSKKRKKPGMSEQETAQFLMVDKVAKVNEQASRTVSRASDGVTSGLKYDSSTQDSTHEEVSSSIDAEKLRKQKYAKAKNR